MNDYIAYGDVASAIETIDGKVYTGKYQKQGNSILMPLSIQVYHAVCDGFHVAKLIETLQEYCTAIQFLKQT